MKAKLRKIVVDSREFYFRLLENPVKEERISDYIWYTTVRIFKRDFKNTPLEIKFESLGLYPGGNSLTSDLKVSKNGKQTELNLNHPAMIRQLIELGIKQGWDWNEKKMLISNGVEILKQMGFKSKHFELPDDLKLNH